MIGILEPLADFNFILYLMLALMLETPPSIKANVYVSSRPQPYRHMLEEMHYRKDSKQQAQQRGGVLYTELRGEVP